MLLRYLFPFVFIFDSFESVIQFKTGSALMPDLVICYFIYLFQFIDLDISISISMPKPQPKLIDLCNERKNIS